MKRQLIVVLAPLGGGPQGHAITMFPWADGAGMLFRVDGGHGMVLPAAQQITVNTTASGQIEIWVEDKVLDGQAT